MMARIAFTIATYFDGAILQLQSNSSKEKIEFTSK